MCPSSSRDPVSDAIQRIAAEYGLSAQEVAQLEDALAYVADDLGSAFAGDVASWAERFGRRSKARRKPKRRRARDYAAEYRRRQARRRAGETAREAAGHKRRRAQEGAPSQPQPSRFVRRIHVDGRRNLYKTDTAVFRTRGDLATAISYVQEIPYDQWEILREETWFQFPSRRRLLVSSEFVVYTSHYDEQGVPIPSPNRKRMELQEDALNRLNNRLPRAQRVRPPSAPGG